LNLSPGGVRFNPISSLLVQLVNDKNIRLPDNSTVPVLRKKVLIMYLNVIKSDP